MARAILLAAAVAWVVLAAAAVILALAGVTWLLERLPPLTIDADAVRGATLTIAAAAGLVAAAHALVLVGLSRARRWGSTLAILLTSLLAVLLFALGVAAVTSVAADPSTAAWLLPSAACAGGAAASYSAALARLVADRRSASVRAGRPR